MKLLLLFFISTIVIANSDYEYTFDDVALAGSGCKRGTASVIKDPSNQSVSILFDNFTAEVPQFSGDNDNDELEDGDGITAKNDVRVTHKRCRIVVRGKLPIDEKVISLDVAIQFRGSTQTQQGANALFRSKLLEWRGPHQLEVKNAQIIEQKLWRGNSDDNWTISKNLSIPVHSNCSGRGNRDFKFAVVNVLRASINPRFNPQDTYSMIFMDTADIGPQMKILIKTKKCGGRGREVRPQPRGRGRAHGRGRR